MNGPDIDLLSIRFGASAKRSPPLGPLSLVGALTRGGLSWRLTEATTDLGLDPSRVDALAAWMVRSDARSIGVSLFNDAVPLVIAALDIAGPELGNRRVFIGGPGVVGIGPALIRRVHGATAVIQGEGDTALPMLLTDPERALAMPGVFSAASNLEPTSRTTREAAQTWGRVHWDWCKDRGYCAVPLLTARGCSYECAFCEIASFLGRRVVGRSTKAALDDLERGLNVIPTKLVDVVDDTFTASKARALRFCAELSGRRLGVRFSVFSRADTLDDELVDALADAGCSRIYLGIDSHDESILRAIGKRADPAQGARAVKAAARRCEVVVSLIWGYPFETWSAFDRTMRFANECAATDRVAVQMHLLSPSAGTPLFDQFHDHVLLDVDADSSLVSGSIRKVFDGVASSRVSEIIRAEPLLSAPYYRYATERFQAKQRCVRHFYEAAETSLGRELLQLAARRGGVR